MLISGRKLLVTVEITYLQPFLSRNALQFHQGSISDMFGNGLISRGRITINDS